MRAVIALLVTVLSSLLAAACAGSGGSPTATESTGGATTPTSAPEVAKPLDRFIEAAANGDIDTMWSLLTAESRKRLGPTEADFADERAEDFRTGLGAFAGTGYRVVLSAELPSGWGVAAVAGPRIRAGKTEYAAYAAAVRQEGGRWLLDLDAPIAIASAAPQRATEEKQPLVDVTVEADVTVDEAGLWLDGEPLPATPGGGATEVRLTAHPETPLATGWHVVVIFGRAGDTAAAGAIPFRVDPSGTVA